MNGREWEQVGTVEILRSRVYPIDPNNIDGVLRSEVFVEPGKYPVYRKFDAYVWMMTGQLNERQEKLGDGLFAMHGGDNPAGLQVTFPSKTFGREQFAELLAEECCQDGPEQRLRFAITEQVSA